MADWKSKNEKKRRAGKDWPPKRDGLARTIHDAFDALDWPGENRGTTDIITDAVLRDYVVIARSDLPVVGEPSDHDPDSYRVEGQSIVYTSAANARMWVLRDVAVWQYIEVREKAGLVKRRDELAAEFIGFEACRYSEAAAPMRAAIDRIVELEKKVGKAE